jgi:uncharacterized membrane protein
MEDFVQLSKRIFTNEIRPILIALLAFFGMVDALYLSMKRNAGPILCHIAWLHRRLTSKYSEIAGVPLSWIGFAFYVTIFSLAIFKIFEDSERASGVPLRGIFYLSGTALIISALLVGIQAFILKAFCDYCLLSAALVLSIFLLCPHPVPHKPRE